MQDFIDAVIKWQDSTFLEGNMYGVMNHLDREYKEFKEVADLFVDDHFRHLPLACQWDARENLGKEMADMVLLIISAASHCDIDLNKAVWEKLEINKKRKWGKPDAEGVVSHIKEV